MDRNSVLHDTPLAGEMSGALKLDRALESECVVGFNLFIHD